MAWLPPECEARLVQLDHAPPKLKAILQSVRRSEHRAIDYAPLKAWLEAEFKRGVTTRAEVVRVFGTRWVDLDSAPRHSLRSVEYLLWCEPHPANYDYLLVDFDAATDTVADWSIGRVVCGFCPHVFSEDGRWRLEGKLLAGCIGPDREGVDVLALPRATGRDGTVRVRIANLAPEIEYLDCVHLGVVDLQDGEELDVGADGSPAVWRPERELVLGVTVRPGEGAEAALGSVPAGSVLALEVRNNERFEQAMRGWVFGKDSAEPDAGLVARFDDGARCRIEPVGTKFLRRVVLPVPPGSRTVQIADPGGFWLVRRAWIGAAREVTAAVAWVSPSDAPGAPKDAMALLRDADGRRIRLGPMECLALSFGVPPDGHGGGRRGYVARMRGYYDFIEP